ncbi:MAG: Holliday junction resolvase RuvX, partial [archaeon]
MIEENTKSTERVVGIDFGSKRIGVAISDELGLLAFPLAVISGFGHLAEKRDSKIEQSKQELLLLLKEKLAKTVVIGLSVNLKGEENEIMGDAKYLGDWLTEGGFNVVYEPEMFSTVQATKIQGENKQVDASAAAIILQSYLDRIKFKNMEIQTDKEESSGNQIQVTQPSQRQDLQEKFITIDDFIKVEIKIGQIVSAEKVEGSDKLLKLAVDFGEENQRQVLSGIAKYVELQEIIGKKFPFVTNLAPRKMMGMESQAMILAGSFGEDLALLNP